MALNSGRCVLRFFVSLMVYPFRQTVSHLNYCLKFGVHFTTCIRNDLKFRFIFMDSWFSLEENFDFITGQRRHFIAALKDNRLVALSEDNRKKKRFVRLDGLDFSGQTGVQAWLKGYAKAV